MGHLMSETASMSTKSAKPVNHRIPEREWLFQHEAEYRGAWVALEGPDLIATGTSPSEVLEAAGKLGIEHPLIHHIPKEPEPSYPPDRSLSKSSGMSRRVPGPINYRYAEHVWLQQHEAEYRGAWVALEGSELIASGPTLKEVMETARKLGHPHPLVHRIPNEPELPFGGW